MADVVNSVVINYKSVGLDKVGADLKQASTAIDGLVVSSATAFRATTELENKFKGLQKSTTAYTSALSEARGAAVGLAAGIGPLGAVLGSFGPWGIAAAAGIGLVTNAITYLTESAGKMGDEAVKLKQFSDISGLTTAQIRGLSEAGQELGVSADTITGGIQKFTVNLDAARKGSGDLYEQLRVIDKELADQIASTRSSSEALDLLAKAYHSITDATTKAALARAAFGKGGAEAGPVLGLLDEAGGVEKYSQAAAKALGITDEWTRRVAALRNENKDLADDIKTIEGALHSQTTLQIENTLLKERLEIIKATRDAIQAGAPSDMQQAGLEQVAAAFGTTRAAAEELTKARDKDTAAANAGAAASETSATALNADTAATRTNTDAKNANADALAKVASQSAKNVAALGTAATPEERGQAKIDALNASFAKGEISAKILERSIGGVRDDTEKAAKAADEAANHTSEAAKAADEWRKNVREAQNAFNATVFSAQAVADATDIIAENIARASKTAADLAYVMEHGIFAPNVMKQSGTFAGKLGETQTIQQKYEVQADLVRRGLDTDLTPPEYRTDQGPIGLGSSGLTGAYDEAIKAQQEAAKDNTNAIDNLTASTDKLNATNQELLSPYYTQDPRTSHIGFRSQGMASGGYVDVPGGYSANDNMMAMVPVASGERIYVDPNTSKRGGGGGVTINISSPITINGNANADQFGRTVYQANQHLAKQVRAATQ